MQRPLAIWKQILLSVLVIGAAAGLWIGQDRVREVLGLSVAASTAPGKSRPDGVPVILARVEMARDTVDFEVVGTGRAQHSILLRSEDEGKVVETALAAGARFEAGDMLLRLDDRTQRVALELAKTRLAEAKRVFDRYSQLQDSGATAVARFDEVRTSYEIAELELEQAREELADRTLRAPFAGVSGQPEIEAGDWIDSGDTIASYDDRSTILVEVDLPEVLLSRVEPGLTVTATTPAFGARRFEGEVVSIDSRVETASRTARVRVAIPNEHDLLRPGASFSVRMELTGERFPRVPELAVQFSRGSLLVWRVEDGKAERVDVRLVRRRDGAVLVDGPLDEGDLVVVEGTQRLAPGKPVSVIGAPEEVRS